MHPNAISNSCKDMFRVFKLIAAECIKLTPFYWLYQVCPPCLVIVAFIMVTTSILSTTWSARIAVDWITSITIRCIKTYPNLMPPILTSPELVLTVSWWMKNIGCSGYLTWAAWKSWHIISKVRSSNNSSQDQKQSQPSQLYQADANSLAPRMFALGPSTTMPDNLKQASIHILNTPEVIQHHSSTDGTEWSPWSLEQDLSD
jgi:hypothetical protein